MSIKMDCIQKIVNDNIHLMNNINHIKVDDINGQITRMVVYSNYLYENKLKNDTQIYRYYIWDGYAFNQPYANLFRIFLFHILNKYEDVFNKIPFTNEIEEYFKKIIGDCNDNDGLCVKEFFKIDNHDGLNREEIYKLLQHHTNLKKYPVKATNIDDIINFMYSLEDDCENENMDYGLFHFSVIGNNCSHCNLFLFDRIMMLWYRIEPGGLIFKDNYEEITNQYYGIDTMIKNVKSNYMSQNDYYYLPGMHFVNPGPYCGYYSAMIVDEYIGFGMHDMYQVVEKVTCLEYVGDKLEEYKNKV